MTDMDILRAYLRMYLAESVDKQETLPAPTEKLVLLELYALTSIADTLPPIPTILPTPTQSCPVAESSRLPCRKGGWDFREGHHPCSEVRQSYPLGRANACAVAATSSLTLPCISPVQIGQMIRKLT